MAVPPVVSPNAVFTGRPVAPAAPTEAERRLLAQNRVLELIAAAAPLTAVLEEIVVLVQQQLPGSICSILLLDQVGGRLRFGAGQALPHAYSAAIDGIEIGPEVGSCGTAAFRGETVIVRDIASDPLWRNFRGLALQHGLASCWSVPIFRSGAEAGGGASGVLGTFALYQRQVGAPPAGAAEAMSAATHLAGLAIERVAAVHRLRGMYA